NFGWGMLGSMVARKWRGESSYMAEAGDAAWFLRRDSCEYFKKLGVLMRKTLQALLIASLTLSGVAMVGCDDRSDTEKAIDKAADSAKDASRDVEKGAKKAADKTDKAVKDVSK